MTEEEARRLCTRAHGEGHRRSYWFPSGARVTYDDRWPRLPVRDEQKSRPPCQKPTPSATTTQ